MNIYSVAKTEDKNKYLEYLENALRELEAFFEFKLDCQPCLIFLKSRQEFDDICGFKTTSWTTGYSNFNLIFLLDETVYEKESSKKYNPDSYPLTIKHELCHFFYKKLSWTKTPVWLNEGLSLHLAGQTKFRPPVTKFEHFLDFFDDEQQTINGTTVYGEAGFAVEKLINKFGKDKLIKLLTAYRKERTPENFSNLFKTIYGFDLNYNNFNSL